jgi:hypothetical protein
MAYPIDYIYHPLLEILMYGSVMQLEQQIWILS